MDRRRIRIARCFAQEDEVLQRRDMSGIEIERSTPVFPGILGSPVRRGDLAEQAFELLRRSRPVSYTHLTLPTICSV